MRRSSRDNLQVIEDGHKEAIRIKDKLLRMALTEIAQESVQAALTMKGYTNRTFNLHDSYGYGIFLGGNLERVQLTTPMATERDRLGGSGSDRAARFIREEYTPHSPNELVVVAGEFYARTLEDTFGRDVLIQGYLLSKCNAAAIFQRTAKRMG